MCLKAITTTNQRRGKYLWELMRNNQTNCQKRGKRRATKSWLISVLLLIGRAGGASFLRQSQSELKQNRYNLFWNVLDDKLFSSFTDCSLGLGMITGDIRNSQITASSSYSEWTQPFAGRLWHFNKVSILFYSILLSSDWFRKLPAILSTNQIQSQTNCDLVTRVFPRFTLFASFFTFFLFLLFLMIFPLFWSLQKLLPLVVTTLNRNAL